MRRAQGRDALEDALGIRLEILLTEELVGDSDRGRERRFIRDERADREYARGWIEQGGAAAGARERRLEPAVGVEPAAAHDGRDRSVLDRAADFPARDQSQHGHVGERGRALAERAGDDVRHELVRLLALLERESERMQLGAAAHLPDRHGERLGELFLCRRGLPAAQAAAPPGRTQLVAPAGEHAQAAECEDAARLAHADL